MPREFLCFLMPCRALLCIFCGAIIVAGNPGFSQSNPSFFEMNSPSQLNSDKLSPLLSQDGYDLLNLMASRAGMGLVSNFNDLKKKNNGLVMILGNGNSLIPWNEIEAWVGRGGVLLVAFDEAPPSQVQNRLHRLTGYQWSNLRLKYMGEKGVDLLPERSFTDIQKLVPFDWSLSATNDLSPTGAKPKGMAHTNSPSFLLSMDGPESMGAVFAKLPVSVELDFAPGVSMRLPSFRADFGVVANIGQGKVIQLADPDVFSNQMLELQGNFQFVWSILQSVKKGQSIASVDFPIMIVGKHIESEVYSLPVPPVPMPELDFFQLASLATRALDEKLPGLEKPGGLFDRLSNRIASRMNGAFWFVLGAIFVAFLGSWYFYNQRNLYRSMQIASQTYSEALDKLSDKKIQKEKVSIEESRGKMLSRLTDSKSGKEIALWELGQIAQGQIANARSADSGDSINESQVKAARRLMVWITSGVFPKSKMFNKSVDVLVRTADGVSHPRFFSNGKNQPNKHLKN